jgi:hypothetical protein
MDTAQAAPDTVILAEDEASLYLQATSKAVWHWRGETPVVKLHPGRESVHFYGTLNLQTGREIGMHTKVMNAETTALPIQQLLAAHPGKPILLFLDRAPWHQGPPIQTVLAANPRLELMYSLRRLLTSIHRSMSGRRLGTPLATITRLPNWTNWRTSSRPISNLQRSRVLSLKTMATVGYV